MAGGMAGGAPPIGQFKGELAAAKQQEKQAAAGKVEISKNISSLKAAIGQAESGMKKIRTELAKDIPPPARKQLNDQLSQLSNQKKKYEIQLNRMKEELGKAGKVESAMGRRKRMIEQALSKMVGQMSMRPMNREAKSTKG